uniref:3-phosphoinositide-dependent protein kinase-1 n=1 Tax=Rhizophora mucronata TaxID=61149 RepID=A0A2P2MHE7_RHIMU
MEFIIRFHVPLFPLQFPWPCLSGEPEPASPLPSKPPLLNYMISIKKNLNFLMVFLKFLHHQNQPISTQTLITFSSD